MTGPGTPTSPASIEVFYSYAHEDEVLVKELRKHLSILKWEGVIREWYDREITAGTEWKGQLDQHLNSSGIILLLVSADFLASKYCYDVEMRRALERHDQGEARVIPVLLRMVDGWQGAPFGKLQSLPTDGKPVTSWKICDEAFADVARGIRNAIGQPGVLQSPVGTTTVGQAFWNVPHPRNPSFTGREAEIAGLRERLDRKGKTALAQAISGLGGIGKTQTAVEYAYRYRDEYKAVLWLNAESPLSLKTGCGDIARQMPLPHDEKDLDQAAAAVKYWLGTHPDWLLILDNADDPGVLEPFLPTNHEGHILITSRAQDFQYLDILDPVELGELPIEDATAFLLRRCGREGADEAERGAARELAGELDGLPLALEQAAAYIVATRATFQRYLESYRTGGLARLKKRRPALGRYPNSVATTWTANFAAVQADSEAAVDVLWLSAFLAPDAIPFELLTRGVSQLGSALEAALSRAEGDPLAVNDVLQALGRFSLIRIDGERETFGIHRMVQEVLRAAMDDAPRRLWAERAVRAVNQAFPNVEYANWPLCDRLLPHALAVVPWIERDRMVFPAAGRLPNADGLLPARARSICRRRAALQAGDGDSSHGPGRAASRLRRLAEQPGGAVRRDGPPRRGRAALQAGDGDSSHGPGRAASRLRHLAEQPGGAVLRDGPPRRGRAALQAGDGDSSHGPGRAASRLRRLAEQPGGAVRRDGPSRRGRAALQAGDGDSSHGPGRAASRLRRLAEQPGGAVPTRWAATPRPSRCTSRRWRFVARPWASGIPTTPPR